LYLGGFIKNMTESDIIEYKSKTLSKEIEKIQKALMPLGYEVQGFRKKNSAYYFALDLLFVGSSVFSGYNSGSSTDGNNEIISQNLGNCPHSAV